MKKILNSSFYFKKKKKKYTIIFEKINNEKKKLLAMKSEISLRDLSAISVFFFSSNFRRLIANRRLVFSFGY